MEYIIILIAALVFLAGVLLMALVLRRRENRCGRADCGHGYNHVHMSPEERERIYSAAVKHAKEAMRKVAERMWERETGEPPPELEASEDSQCP